MVKYADDLQHAGLDCTSRWLQEKYSATTQLGDVRDAELQKFAGIDLDDVKRSDIIVFFSQSDQTPTFRGGRHVEFGYALACNKIILVVGPKENIFHYLPAVAHFDTWTEALENLKDLNDYQAL